MNVRCGNNEQFTNSYHYHVALFLRNHCRVILDFHRGCTYHEIYRHIFLKILFFVLDSCSSSSNRYFTSCSVHGKPFAYCILFIIPFSVNVILTFNIEQHRWTAVDDFWSLPIYSNFTDPRILYGILFTQKQNSVVLFSAVVVRCVYGRDVPDIQNYPVSGQESGIRFNPVSCIQYKTISSIIRYPVSGRISYLVLFSILPTAAKHHSHWSLWYLKFLAHCTFLHIKLTLQTLPSNIRYYPVSGFR